MDSACKPEYRAYDAGMREPNRRIGAPASSRDYSLSNGRLGKNRVPPSGTLSTVIRPA